MLGASEPPALPGPLRGNAVEGSGGCPERSPREGPRAQPPMGFLDVVAVHSGLSAGLASNGLVTPGRLGESGAGPPRPLPAPH